MKHEIEALTHGMAELRASAKRMNDLLRQISTLVAAAPAGFAEPGLDMDLMTRRMSSLVKHTSDATSAVKDRAACLAAEVARLVSPADT